MRLPAFLTVFKAQRLDGIAEGGGHRGEGQGLGLDHPHFPQGNSETPRVSWT